MGVEIPTTTQSPIITTTQSPGKNKTTVDDKLKCIYHERVFENGEIINPKELDYDKQLETCIEHCTCENNTIVCYQVTCDEIFIEDPKRCKKVKLDNECCERKVI